MRNRFARVWPVHLLTLNVDLALAALLGTLGVGADGHRRTPQAYVENVAMVHTWFSDRPSFNAPAWSISSEWFAYLLAPLLFVVVARLRRAGSALLLAGAAYAAMLAVFATMALPNGNLEQMFYVRILGEFLGGMLLCLAWVRGGARLGAFVVVLPATLVVLAVVPAAAAGHYWAAPALGLGVAGLAGSSGWVTSALSWPARGGGGGVLRALHDAPARPAVRALAAAVGGGVGVGRGPGRDGAGRRARRDGVAPARPGRAAGPAPAAGPTSGGGRDAERRAGPCSGVTAPPNGRGGSSVRPESSQNLSDRMRGNRARDKLKVLRTDLLHPPAATAPPDAHEVHAAGFVPITWTSCRVRRAPRAQAFWVCFARNPSIWLMAVRAPSSIPMSSTFCRSSAES